MNGFFRVLFGGILSMQCLFISILPAQKNKLDCPEQYVLVGSYTGTGYNQNGLDSGIYVYRIQRETGSLEFVSASPSVKNPSYLAIHPGKEFIYCVNENQPGQVTSFQLDPENLNMKWMNQQSSGGNYPCYISLDSRGKFLLVANYGTGSIASIALQPDGRIGSLVSEIQHQGSSVNKKRQEGPHAHMILPAPDGNYIFASDLGTDEVNIYSLDAEKGIVKETEYKIRTEPGAGPRHIAFHSGGRIVYVLNELNGTIEAWNWEPEKKNLKRFQIISTLAEGDQQFAGCADIHIHPNGKFLYASNRGNVNSIALFQIDPGSGKLSYKGQQSTLGISPRSFLIDPEGKYLWVANQKSNNIIPFRMDEETGMLKETGVSVSVPAPVCLKFLSIHKTD